MIPARSLLRFGTALAAASLALPAWPQAASEIRVRASYGVTHAGAVFGGTWDCTGTPTCRGTYHDTDRPQNCSNAVVTQGALEITGLNLSSPGPISGTVTLRAIEKDAVRQPDGTCTYTPRANGDLITTYTGQWDGAHGTMAVADDNSTFPVTFRAELPPVFPMVVRASIDAVTATAAADIQFRPQDVGTTGSVFVFATAPSSRVVGGNAASVMKVGLARDHVRAFEKADSCVISQLNSAGQLVAVTAAQLQAYLSGALSAQGASVTIMDRVPTPNVAGATFYVGYGTSSQRMLSEGIFRNAVQVPGSDVCPMLPAHTALWWNSRESGWGINLNHQGATVFGTLFTYDASRAPLWLVMSDGRMQSDGITYTGDLYRTTGPAFNANPFTPIGPSNLTRVGSMTVRFDDANAATLTYTVNDVQVVKNIERQVYGTRAANCLPTSENRAAATNYQDLWWNPAESGWGVNVTHQDNILFATLFTYDAGGRGLWLVMSGGARQADGSFTGDLFQTSGPAFNTMPFGGVTIQPVGTMRLRFSDGNNGTLTYTYAGTTVTKAIQRQVFSTTVSTCN